MDTEKSSWPLWLHVTVGIVVAAAVLWLGTMMVFASMARVALDDLQKSHQVAVDRSRERRELQAKRERDLKVLQAQVLQRRSSAPLQVESRQLERALSWEAYFQPSPECLSTVSVACGNAHMRAKNEFDRKWEAGEL